MLILQYGFNPLVLGVCSIIIYLLPNRSSQQSDIIGEQLNNLEKIVERMESPEEKTDEMKVEVAQSV